MVPPPEPAPRDPGFVPLTEPVPDTLEFTCPRCAQARSEPWYGPCGECRATLRAQYHGEARSVEAEAYEPKMNVTPNAVATKD
jgi:hypothetical protein